MSTFNSSFALHKFFLVHRDGPVQKREHRARQGREFGKWFFLVKVELQRDFEHFDRFDSSVGKSEDWYSNLSGGGVGCLGIEIILVLVLILWWWSGLMIGIWGWLF